MELPLRSGANNYLVDINIGRLLDRERNSAGDCIRGHRKLVSGDGKLGFHLQICHRFREVRPDKPRRNDRHAQLIAGLLAQSLGDGAHGELRAGIDRLVRYGLMSRCRSGVAEMPETLLAEERQRCRDAVQNTFDVDVDHVLAILDAQVIEGRNWHNAGIVDENVELAVPLARQF